MSKTAGSQDKNNRFVCYVALRDQGFVTSEALCGEIIAHFPQMVRKLGVPVGRGTAASAEQASLIEFGGVLLAAMFVEAPLPRDAWERAVALDRVWPKAREAMARHKAHAIVSNVAGATNHGEALMAASAVTVAVAALARLVPAAAVVWAAGETIASPERFEAAAQGFEQKQIPADIWMSITWLDGPVTPTGERTLATLTTGLVPFVGREIEFMPTTMPPVTIAKRLLGTAQYLIVNGPILKDGDTLGISESELIRVRLADRGQRPNVPVIRLSLERLDTAPQSDFRLPGLGAGSQRSTKRAFGKRRV